METKTAKINSLFDFKISRNKFAKGETKEYLMPGKSREHIAVFKFNDLDLPYTNLKEFAERKSSKYLKDFGEIVVKQGLSIAQEKRLKNYNINHSQY